MHDPGEFAQIDPAPVPEVVIAGTTIPVTELLRYSLVHDVRFEIPLERIGPEFVFTGSILMSEDKRLYFVPSGKFQELKSIAEAGPGTDD